VNSQTVEGSTIQQTEPRVAVGLAALRRHWVEILVLPFAVWALALYQVEGGDALLKIMGLAAGGFVVSCMLPLAARLPFFVLLSVAGIFAVLGFVDGAWLLSVGFVLIGLCHLRVPFLIHAVIIVAVAIGMAMLRKGLAPVPWGAAVWPVLASMFMFRLILYMKSVRAARTDKNPPATDQGAWSTLAYFFMLPNVVFPLFPVVDHQTFLRTRFDRGDSEIYRTGLSWIARGVLHLVIYRIVYLTVLGDPADVATLGDLVQYMFGTFLLYLRVSGQFHLIVGILYLFGFRLPETHKLYYLAHSFTELWRRINIYWTEFMMKVVFYPTYFKVKRLKPATAMVISTAAVFVVTWALHSYQWFWLRGEAFFTLPDLLFWTILGALVIHAGLKELKSPKKLKPRVAGWSGGQAFRAVRTFVIFCLLWSLWSAESLGQWLWMLGSAAVVDIRGVVLLVGLLGVIAGLGGYDWNAKETATQSRWATLREPRIRALATVALLVLLAHPAISNLLPASASDAIGTVRARTLNAHDAALRHRGYYEQLDGRNQLVAHNATDADGRATWQKLNDLGVIRERQDELLRDLAPSRHFVWNGKQFSTNAFGMRDREYSLEKPAGTLRIALLGPSHVMGNGVADDETFDHVLEQRLNAGGAGNVEVLNFAVEGYSVPQEVAMFEARARSFDPDIVVLTVFHPCTTMTEQFLLRTVFSAIPIGDTPTRQILERAGLVDVDRGQVPLPYASVRSLAKGAGVDVRMPQGEAEWRVRQVSAAVTARAIQHFAEVVRASGATPAVLVLNGVVDGGPTDVPYLKELTAASLPVLDLSHVYPVNQYASLRVAPWDDHPNAAAHALIATEIQQQLTPVLDGVVASAAPSVLAR
jgi:hypothetical protein